MVSIQDFHYHLIMEFVFNLHFYRCFIYADFNISKISSNLVFFILITLILLILIFYSTTLLFRQLYYPPQMNYIAYLAKMIITYFEVLSST